MRTVRQGLAIILALLLGGCLSVGVAPGPPRVHAAAHHAAPTISVQPAAVPPGGQVVVSATGFAPHTTLTILINDDGRTLALVPADAAGALPPTQVTIPATLPTGAHTLSVIDTAAHRGVSAQIAVGPTVFVTPATVAPGAQVMVAVAGFSPDTTLNVVISGYDGSIGVVTTDGSGAVSPTPVAVPATLDPGAHTLSVVNTGTHTGASATVTLAPTLSATPTVATRGTPVTITAAGFEPGAALNVLITGYAGSIGVVTAGASGAVSATAVALPATLTPGAYTLSLVNTASRRSASTRITVTAALAITVTPAAVKPGGQVTVTATGFTPGAFLNILIGGYAGSAGVVKANAEGTVPPTRITLPATLTPGVHAFSVVNTASRRHATTQITITGAPSVSVTPTMVQQGGVLTVTATGFDPHAQLNVLLSGYPGAFAVVRSDATGAVPPTRLIVPAALVPGSHTLSVVNTGTHRGASTRLTVLASTATVSVEPPTTNRGGVVTVLGRGFGSAEPVAVSLSGVITPLATITATADGAVPATGIGIPYRLAVGPHTLRLTGRTSGRTASAAIQINALQPRIALSAGTVTPGTRETVTGSGFGLTEQVTLALNGQALATSPTAITTTNGTFTAAFTVPATLERGANTVSAIGNQSRVSAVAALTGTLTRAARVYFAGGMNTATAHSTLQVLNPAAQPASLRLIFYFENGGAYTRLVSVPAHAQRAIPVATLNFLPAGTFGLEVRADRPIAAQLTIARDGKDGDTLPGNTGLGTRWYLAEGYTGLTFRESVSVLNPNPTAPAHVQMQLLPFGGRPGKTVVVTVAPHTNRVVSINDLMPGQSLSIIASSDLPVVVERTLTFSTVGLGGTGYGLTTSAGSNTPATSWLFAEGTTVNRFQTFLTILNPNALPATVTASFFGQTGGGLGSRTLVVAPRSRANIKLNDFLNASGIASAVTSDLPVVVERPEYFGSPNDPAIAGSDVFGRNGAGVRWSFPAGDTRGHSEFLLLYNPSAVTVPIDATFYGPEGGTVTKRVYVPPTVRYNIDVNRLVPGFNARHGAVLQSLNGQGFVAEQTVFAPDHSTLRSTEGVAQ